MAVIALRHGVISVTMEVMWPLGGLRICADMEVSGLQSWCVWGSIRAGLTAIRLWGRNYIQALINNQAPPVPSNHFT